MDVNVNIENKPLKVHADYSRFVRRIRRRYAAELGLLAVGAPGKPEIEALVVQLKERGYGLGAALRVARQLVVERLVVLDVEQQAPLQTVMQVMSDLAELALKMALNEALRELDAEYGVPRSADGSRCAFWIMGMGKLGGRELNVSSDIDLIYLYEEGGYTARDDGQDGEGADSRCSNHEYFNYLAKKLYALIGEVTEHGFVFRMDLALRPNGSSGPLAVSLPMLRDYFKVDGRDWERFAWMKSRVVTAAGDASQKKEEKAKLKHTIRSFVYRGYLDFTLLNSLRQTHLKIRQQEADKEALCPELAVDVKLARGGIRELEFTVQLFQVIRGGQFPEIRTASTLQGLQRLAETGLLLPARAQQLHEAYVFLRQVEHHIQYLDDLQTHTLPADEEDIRWIAGSLYFGEPTDETQQVKHLYEALGSSRQAIAAQFDEWLSLAPKECSGMLNPIAYDQTASHVLGGEGFEALLPESIRERVHYWAQSTRVKGVKERIKNSLSHLILRSVGWVKEGGTTELAVLRFIDWLDAVLRRESYQALLLERPLIHQRLLRVLDKAHWAAIYLRHYPGVVDELRDEEVLEGRFDKRIFEQSLRVRRKALESTEEEDEESLMNVLRRAHHAEFFRTLVRDIEGQLSVEQVADDLSALADVTLKVALEWSWGYLVQRHREKPQIGIVAYGKLGGIELGYGSDLDIVFIYDDDDERAAEVYSTHVRKLIAWLTSKTSEGDLFEIDTSLRPNGSSGLLVTSIEAFEAYQLGRGSNTAWTWEHQALTRARCVVGTPEMARRFDMVRHQVITAKRDQLALRQEVQAMRAKVSEAHVLNEGRMDVKYSHGAMLDIEFCVQYLVLAYSWQYPELEEDVGNIALLLRAQNAGLIPAPIGEKAADSYRLLRQMQHYARLNEGDVLDSASLEKACEVGAALWECVFYTG